MKRADLIARSEIQTIAAGFTSSYWEEAFGSSGTARALGDIIHLNSFDSAGREGDVTLEGLENFREYLLRVGDVKKLELAGLRPDRAPVIPGGFVIMSAAFSELGIRRMSQAMGALRQGVLYDLLGRFQNTTCGNDRKAIYATLPGGCHPGYTGRITGVSSGEPIIQGFPDELEELLRILSWAARLHEVGISVAHSGYHKHSAYILGNADMPGFSRREQDRLSLLALAHRGTPVKVRDSVTERLDFALIFSLRLAVVFHRSRSDIGLPRLEVSRRQNI